MQKRIAVLASLILAFATLATAQMEKSKRPSPPASAVCNLPGGKTIKTDYSSPRMKGRKIYGGLVPFGEVWRAGANEATTFVSNADLSVGARMFRPAATPFSPSPTPDKWTLIINKTTGEWGIPYKPEYQAAEVARIDMNVSPLPSPVEDFTISYALSGDGCTLQMDWETTRASVDISEEKNKSCRRSILSRVLATSVGVFDFDFDFVPLAPQGLSDSPSILSAAFCASLKSGEIRCAC